MNSLFLWVNIKLTKFCDYVRNQNMPAITEQAECLQFLYLQKSLHISFVPNFAGNQLIHAIIERSTCVASYYMLSMLLSPPFLHLYQMLIPKIDNALVSQCWYY
ncbi:hypothetical protein EUGRSUZ_A01033 [Eucalyptus grandis]|uniref:Uncharacterized protein n=2 Tax=Eucalyptus grandis TaxID=71139 RepID=A0ACC3M4W5_EUCGR|nr:hypothetical protein EUGRSUZ_A01033 [Eucalyptus grandis]